MRAGPRDEGRPHHQLNEPNAIRQILDERSHRLISLRFQFRVQPDGERGAILERKSNKKARIRTICKMFVLVHRETLLLKCPSEAGYSRQQLNRAGCFRSYDAITAVSHFGHAQYLQSDSNPLRHAQVSDTDLKHTQPIYYHVCVSCIGCDMPFSA